jgi:hypothetical protein
VSSVRYKLSVHIPEDGVLHSHRRDNPISDIYLMSQNIGRCGANWVMEDVEIVSPPPEGTGRHDAPCSQSVAVSMRKLLR